MTHRAPAPDQSGGGANQSSTGGGGGVGQLARPPPKSQPVRAEVALQPPLGGRDAVHFGHVATGAETVGWNGRRNWRGGNAGTERKRPRTINRCAAVSADGTALDAPRSLCFTL